MKKIFVSAGLVAASAAGWPSAHADALDVISPKAWSIGGTLRGFYDDNYNISSTKRGSWGVEVTPTISYNLPLQQSDMGIRYIYGLYYYNDRDSLGLNPFDQTHQIDVWLDHAINERWKINFSDSFAVGQEPELLQPNPLGGQAVPYRVNGNNIANHASVSLDTQWTRLFGTSLHYGNDFYNYQNRGGAITDSAIFPAGLYQIFPVKGNNLFGNNPGQFASLGANGASLAGLLNRDEQNIGLDFNWTLSPETTLSLGYTFSWVNYLGNEPVAVFNYIYKPNGATPAQPQSYVYNSSSRDGTSHEAHVGLNHELTSNLTLAMSVGVSYTENSNDPFNHNRSFSPDATASLNYTYTPGSYVQLGVSQGENSTDVVQPGVDGSLTQYQNTTSVFADINQRITEKLSGSLIGRFAYSTYQGGAANSQADYDYGVNLNLAYQISRHFSADAGYNFDDLVSGLLGRGYVRNRVYLGMSANY